MVMRRASSIIRTMAGIWMRNWKRGGRGDRIVSRTNEIRSAAILIPMARTARATNICW
jgi:hypothetical protein